MKNFHKRASTTHNSYLSTATLGENSKNIVIGNMIYNNTPSNIVNNIV